MFASRQRPLTLVRSWATGSIGTPGRGAGQRRYATAWIPCRDALRTRICSPRRRTCARLGTRRRAGHGPETLWLAARGWRVTAVDFSATALGHARASAERLGTEAAERIDWIEADLVTWAPPPERYDLVICMYLHVAGSVEELVRRLAAGVAPGGTLLLVGHRPVNPVTGAPTPAAGQIQIDLRRGGGRRTPSRSLGDPHRRRATAAGGWDRRQRRGARNGARAT